MSLFKAMKSGHSYGVVPGNGNPKADDKVMNAAEGHVVPAENAPVAKKLVAQMGYDPNVTVDMNNGGGEGVDVRISSKEYFLNDDQVAQLKARGIDPEMLSPKSPYNKRVNAMANGGNIYSLMTKKGIVNNNNNQYVGYSGSEPSYQDGGGIKLPIIQDGKVYKFDPELQSYNLPGAVGETGPRWEQKSISQSYGPEGVYFDPANPRPTRDEVIAQNTANATADPVNTNQDFVVDYARVEQPNAYGTRTYDAAGNVISTTGTLSPGEQAAGVDINAPGRALTPEDMQAMGFDPSQLVVPGSQDGNAPVNPAQEPTLADTPINTDVPTDQAPGVSPVTDPAAPVNSGMSPEDAHLQYLLDETKKNSNLEIGANLLMMGWNASRERQPLPMPIYTSPRELVRDYEGMKAGALSDLERQNRASAYQMRNLGMTDKLVALDANTKENTLKTNQSLWDLQQQDSMRNISASNQAKVDYNNKVFQRGMLDAEAANAFSQAKGQNIATNAAQIFDVKENRFNNEAVLKGYQTNQKMNELDTQYNSLDKSKLLSSGNGYVSREDWYKMSDEERTQLMDIK